VKNALRSRIEIGRVAEGVDHHRNVFRGVAIDDGRDDCILLHEEVPLLAKPRSRFAKFEFKDNKKHSRSVALTWNFVGIIKIAYLTSN
jgi:hypothetical protein